MRATFLLAIFATASAIRIKSNDEAVSQLIALGQKLGLETTADMFEGQSPEDISNAIIGAALESGKSQNPKTPKPRNVKKCF